ncbi:metallophosphoesterase [Paenibacillus sp. PK3_47]|uniref:metallophosphoesterase n=1 Tax=Paenibacillus sp. PK3_47 TaxID=2072642 RepID=UPI00201D7C6B|nr:metallophosphoesterase [Paenibacillus sp. PK3_47]
MHHTLDNTHRLLVISDIHGHAGGLQLLLDAAEYNPRTDRLVLAGDYIDEDRQSFETLHMIRKLTDEGAVALPGNMETRWLSHSGEVTSRCASLRSWLEGLPPYFEADGYLFVHAGFRPGVPLTEQTLPDMTEIRQDFWEAELPAFAEKGIVFGHTPTFKMGGTAGEIWRRPGKIGIDTGAKHGCRLTLLDVHNRVAYSCSTASGRGSYTDFRADLLVEC